MSTVTIPYRRSCFSLELAKYLQALERMMQDREQKIRADVERTVEDCMLYGRGSFTVR